MGARPAVVDGRAGYSFVVWAPNARAVSVVGDFNLWDGRAPRVEKSRRQRTLGNVRARACRGRQLQVRDSSRSTAPPFTKCDPYGLRMERPPRTASVTAHLGEHAWRDAAWMRGSAGARHRARRPDVRVRSARRIVAAQSARGFPVTLLARAGRGTGAVRDGDGLHAHRADAGDGASVRRIVGVSGHRLFRADQPAGFARRFPRVRGCVSSGRHRRAARLGARAFSERRFCAGAFRRHGAVRTCRSAAGRASGLGHAHLQLRASRSPQFPAVQRAVLAGVVPYRRASRRRRRVHAVPRLFARRRRVGAQPVRRAGEPGCDRLSSAS